MKAQKSVCLVPWGKWGYSKYTSISDVSSISRLNIDCDYYGIPKLNSLEKWGSSDSFYSSENYYLNPSDGLELKTDWFCDGSVCDCDCDSGNGCCSGDCGESGSDYIDISEYHITPNSSPIRQGPGSNYPQIGSTAAGDDLYFTQRTKDYEWYKLGWSPYGWIHSSNLS